MVKFGKDYLIVNYFDFIFWMDVELNVWYGDRIILDSLFFIFLGVGGGMFYIFFDYKDMIIFYNCFIDVIYIVMDIGF